MKTIVFLPGQRLCPPKSPTLPKKAFPHKHVVLFLAPRFEDAYYAPASNIERRGGSQTQNTVDSSRSGLSCSQTELA